MLDSTKKSTLFQVTVLALLTLIVYNVDLPWQRSPRTLLSLVTGSTSPLNALPLVTRAQTIHG